MPSRGQVNYEAYRADAGGVSLIDGSELPSWYDLDPKIMSAWEAGAFAVEQLFAEQFRDLATALWNAVAPVVIAAWGQVKHIVEEPS
jgi:hypothetical protein